MEGAGVGWGEGGVRDGWVVWSEWLGRLGVVKEE
jgi:hypothetical protein